MFKIGWLSFLFWIAATGSPVCGQILPTNPSGYRITPAPGSETALLGSAHSFQWLDGNRVIFGATDRQLSTIERDGGRLKTVKAVFTLHIWDTRSGTIRRYRPEPLSRELCVVDRRIRYVLRLEGREALFEGEFGHEQEREMTRPRTEGATATYPRLNKFSCKEYWFSEMPRPHEGQVIPLREEDGYLERVASGPARLPTYARWMPPYRRWLVSTGGSTEVVFPEGEIGAPNGYSSLTGGYLFWKDESRLMRGISNTFVLWRPKENVVRTLEVPGSQNWTALHYPRITRVGLVAKSSTAVRDPRVKWDPGPAGIYRFYGAAVDSFLNQDPASSLLGQPRFGVEQIVSGLIDAISPVSEDGCKLVVVVDPWDQENRQIRLELIDFCSPRG